MKILSGAIELKFSTFRFPGGEIHFRFSDPISPIEYDLRIRADLRTSDDILLLMVATDAIRRQWPRTFLTLECPYVPYARQDRVCNPGESLGAKVMCDLINSLEFNAVEIWDAHSDVTPALLRNCTNRPASDFVSKIKTYNCIFVAPDAGAYKRVGKCAKLLDRPMRCADKVRDTQTGEITETVIYSNHIGKHDFLMIDDICDGGRTFIELAKVLRPLTDGKIFLGDYKLDICTRSWDMVPRWTYGRRPSATLLRLSARTGLTP